MRIDSPEVMQLLDKVAGMAGETRDEALRRALEERCERLTAAAPSTGSGARDDRLSPEEVSVRLAALRELQESLALTPERARAWMADVRAERLAHRVPGVAYPDDVAP